MTGLRIAIPAWAIAQSGCVRSTPSRARELGLEPRWQDAIDEAPALLVAVRPLALRRDPGVGPLLQRIVDLGRQQSRVVSDTRAFEAMEDAEDVIVAVRPSNSREVDDARDELVVVRGVGANIDPGRLVDSEGQLLWTPGPSGPVRELLHAQKGDGTPADISLFELPARTWVIAAGPARARARRAFAHPLGLPDPPLSPEALAAVRVDGPSLVARVPALRHVGTLGAIGNRLLSVEVALPPSREHVVRAALVYANAAARDQAESAVRSVVHAIQGAQVLPTDWIAMLASAKVKRGANNSVLVECAWRMTSADDALRQRTDAGPQAP